MPAVTAVSPMASGPVLALRGEATRAVTRARRRSPSTTSASFRCPTRSSRAVARLDRRATSSSAPSSRTTSASAVGDKLRIVGRARAPAPTLTITGIVDLGNKGVNQRNTYVALHTAQALLGLIGGVSSIDVTVPDVYAAEDVAQAIARRRPASRPTAGSAPTPSSSSRSTRRSSPTPAIRFFVGARDRLRHRRGADRVGGAEVEGDRHPARDGRLARPDPARVPDRGRGARARRLGRSGSALGAFGDPAVAHLARNPDGTPLFPLELDRGCSSRSAVLATLTGLAAARGAGAARRAARPGGGDPWLTMSCGWKACARPTTSARRSRPRCCTASTSRWRSGEFCALMGPSGSGKSTLLNLDRPARPADGGRHPDRGPRHRRGWTTRALTRLRGHSIGFVFQYHHLLPAFTAVENVLMPMLVDRGRPDAQMRRARRASCSKACGLTPWRDNLAINMSGGQQQRVAVARALAMNPALRARRRAHRQPRHASRRRACSTSCARSTASTAPRC